MLFFSSLHGQSYNYTRYSVADGLAGETVYSIAQDKDGFLWIATETGLSRFDGRTFKNYTISDGLPDNDIIKVFVDSKNRVWVLPFLNKICYIENGVVHNQENDSLLRKVRLNGIAYCINEDGEGNIYILEERRIVVIKEKEIFSINNFENIEFVTAVAGLDRNMVMNFYILNVLKPKKGYHFMLGMLNQKRLNKKYEYYSTFHFPRTCYNINPFYNCFPQNDKMRVVQHSSRTIVSYDIPPHMQSVSYLSDSVFSINCSDTVYFCSATESKIKANIFVNHTINTCFLDTEGNYWIGTRSGGLYCVSSLDFHYYDVTKSDIKLEVYALEKFNGKIIAGTHDGHLLSKAENEYQWSSFSEPRKFRINKLVSTDNSLIIGGDGVSVFKEGTLFYNKQASVKDLYLYGDTLLVGSNVYLLKMRLSNLSKPDTIWEGRVSATGYYFNKYYIGTLGGLFAKDANKNITDYSKINKKLSSKISDFAMDENGILWIATYGKGLLGMNQDSVLYTIDESQGLSSNMCRQVVANDGYLWVATDKGINRISQSAKGYNIQVFGSRHGMVSDIVNCLYIDSNTVYAGTPLGISVFKPDAISNNSICNIRITEIKSVKGKFLFPDSAISFSAGDNSLLITYHGISFKSRENMKYYYRLGNVNNTWQTTTQTTIEYGKLSPGNYFFEIYAENAFGKRSPIQQINISIGSFFNQRWWFYALAGLLSFSLLGYIIYRIFLNARRKSAERQNLLMQMSELEQMALKAQMNPHFIFNCLNSIQQFIFLKNPREVNYFITRFASLIRQTLDFSGQKYVTLSAETKYYETYLQLEKFRFEESLEYLVSVSPEINKEKVILPPLLLQPFVENSIKHGIRHLSDKVGKIKLHFSIEDKKLVCELTDNGIGREASTLLKKTLSGEHQSRGIALAEKRISNINAFAKDKMLLEIEDLKSGDIAAGTKVTLKMPLIHE